MPFSDSLITRSKPRYCPNCKITVERADRNPVNITIVKDNVARDFAPFYCYQCEGLFFFKTSEWDWNETAKNIEQQRKEPKKKK
jgi:uncharacterized protein with PIN domain